MNDTELERALLRLRTSVVEGLLLKLGVAGDTRQVQSLLARNSDSQVLDALILRRNEPSRWRAILRWVEGLGRVR